jgi:hypothetical protein
MRPPEQPARRISILWILSGLFFLIWLTLLYKFMLPELQFMATGAAKKAPHLETARLDAADGRVRADMTRLTRELEAAMGRIAKLERSIAGGGAS